MQDYYVFFDVDDTLIEWKQDWQAAFMETARGAGVEPQDVSGLVKQFMQMRGMMKQMAGLGLGGRLKMTQQMAHLGLTDGAIPRVKKGSTKYQPRREERKKRRRRR